MLSYVALIIAVLLVLFPIYWMIATSLKVPRRSSASPSLIPLAPTLNNYVTLLTQKDFLVAVKNSLIVATTVTIISVLISSFAAYSMVRFRYRFAA